MGPYTYIEMLNKNECTNYCIRAFKAKVLKSYSQLISEHQVPF